jgi:hypothetical protein
MISKLFRLFAPVVMVSLSACASAPVDISQPIWPALPADEIDVHASLKQLVQENPSLKVVLRVPNVTANVTQSQQANPNPGTSLNGAYDEIEKTLFKAGFVVRDRALLSSLIDKEGITSYQEIQKRVDTDLIIDISTLEFDEPSDFLVSRTYPGPDGSPQTFDPSYVYNMAEAVATVEAKLIIVHSGEVAGIITLREPICAHETCPFEAIMDPLNGDSLSAPGQPNHVANFDQNTNTLTYLWATGTGPGSITQAADLLGQKIANVLKQ